MEKMRLPEEGLRRLADFRRILDGERDAARIIGTLAEFLRTGLGAAAGAIAVTHSDWSGTGLPALCVFPEEDGDMLRELSRERLESLAGSGGDPRVLPLPEGARRPAGVEGEMLLADLPLVSKGADVGLVTLLLPREPSGSPALHPEPLPGERDFLSALSDVLALEIVNAALRLRSEHLSREHSTRLRELWILQETNNALRGTVKLNRILRMILAGATAGLGLGFNRAALFLLNHRTNILQGMMGVGPDSHDEASSIWNSLSRQEDISLARQIEIYAENQPRESHFNTIVKGIRVSVEEGEGALASAVRDRTAVSVTGGQSSPDPERELVERLSMSTFAITPIFARDETFGVMVVDNFFDRKPVTDDDLRLLGMFASQAGIAIANAKEIRSHRRDAEELRLARDQLIQSERLAALGEIAAGLAHEIRNPLVTIGGFARRLEKKLDGQDPNRRYAGIIAGEVQRLERFLEEVLLFGRDRRPVPEPFDLEELLLDILHLFSGRFADAGIEVTTAISPELPPLEADANQIRRVLINLLNNAVEAMSEGGELSLGAAAGTGAPEILEITLADTGGGLEPEALGTIFNPFYTTKSRGQGLGLALAQRIVTEHGGRIGVRNRPGHGLTFVIRLPFAGPARRGMLQDSGKEMERRGRQ